MEDFRERLREAEALMPNARHYVNRAMDEFKPLLEAAQDRHELTDAVRFLADLFLNASAKMLVLELAYLSDEERSSLMALITRMFEGKISHALKEFESFRADAPHD